MCTIMFVKTVVRCMHMADHGDEPSSSEQTGNLHIC